MHQLTIAIIKGIPPHDWMNFNPEEWLTSVGDYGEALDEHSTLMSVWCKIIINHPHWIRISGFDDDIWPVCVDDAPLILEQLPSSIAAVAAYRKFAINFYEQTTNRRLMFAPDANSRSWIVRCVYRAGRQSDDSTLGVSDSDLKQMLRAMVDQFRVLVSHCDALTESEIVFANLWFHRIDMLIASWSCV